MRKQYSQHYHSLPFLFIFQAMIWFNGNDHEDILLRQYLYLCAGIRSNKLYEDDMYQKDFENHYLTEYAYIHHSCFYIYDLIKNSEKWFTNGHMSIFVLLDKIWVEYWNTGDIKLQKFELYLKLFERKHESM